MRSFLLALAAVLTLAGSAAAGPAQTPWPMFRGNPQHASTATAPGVAHPRFLWSVSLPSAGEYGFSVDSARPLYGPSIGPDGALYVTGYSRVWSIDPATGGVRWVTPDYGSPVSQPAVSDDGKVFFSSANSVVAVTTNTGAAIWQIDPRSNLGVGFGGGPVTIAPDGSLYAGDEADARMLNSGRYLFAISPSTGGVLWRADNSGACPGATAPAVYGSSVVYYKNDCDSVFAVSASSGGLLGSYRRGNSDMGSLAADGDGSVYTFQKTASINYLKKMDLLAATTFWTTATGVSFGNSPQASPLLSPTLAIVPDTAGSILRAYDKATGVQQWTSPFLSNLGAPLLAGSTIYTIGANNLYSLDTSTGGIRWSFAFGPAVTVQEASGGIAVSSTGALYVLYKYGSSARRLYAFAESNAANVTMSSSPFFYEGSVWVSSVTAVVTTAGAVPVPGQVVLASVQSNGATLLLSSGTQVDGGLTALLTHPSGGVVHQVRADLGSLPHSAWGAFASTVSVAALGLPSSSIVVKETRASTFTVTLSTPSIEDNGTSIVRVTTVTFTVSNSTGGRVTNFAVALDPLAYNVNLGGSCGTPSSVSPAGNFQLTDSTGQFKFVYRVRVAAGSGSSLNACIPYDAFQNLSLPLQAFALGLAPVTVDARDARPSTFTVSFSSPAIQSDVRHATMTVTVYDSVGSTVPGSVVALNNLNTAGFLLASFNNYKNDGTGILCTGSSVSGYTDAFGKARFLLDNRPCNPSTFDNFSDYPSSQPVFTPNIAVATPTIAVESNFLSSYQVAVPTITSVGVAFRSTVTAVNAYGHLLPKYNESGVTLTPLFDQTAVQGTGTLGTSVVSFAASGGQVVISSQTYNKIEDIQVKATRGSGVIKTGLSGTLIVRGPDHFIVTVPTAAQAGVPFAMTVRAVDASSQPVVGYAATISLSALNAGNPLLAGAGVLGITNVNVPANGFVTIANQTYTKAESIVIRASDSGAGVVGVSTYAAVVGAGTPASITVLANPQSTIAGVPSALTATILDGFSNPVTNSTATFSVATGSGVVSLSLTNGAVVSAAVSTQAVTDAFGQATAFFSSTNSLSAQANLLRASLGGLARDTTVYSAVLVTAAGGAVVNSGDPRLRAECPANTYGFAVRLSLQSKAELSAADLALTTAAFSATANTFVSTTVLKISAVRDASPGVAAGPGGRLMKVSMPYVVTSGSISVGSFGAQSILVPLSVMRIFRLNQVSSVFEQVLDGVSAVDSAAGTVTAEVSDPDGIYALGAPAFTTLAAGSSATVTTALAGGTSAQVVVPLGGFAAPATISVTVPGASAVPALPARPGLTGLGITVSVTAGGLQPASPVTLKIGYRLVDVAGINPDHLRLARYDAATGWTVLDSGADTEARQVVGQTDHFSLFQIVAQAPSQSVADGFVFPNPFRPSLGHTNIKLSNLPAAAHVKIFTATGRLLKELDADAAGQVLTWNGADRDGRALASGVYLAVIEGAGGRRTIKFAVQR